MTKYEISRKIIGLLDYGADEIIDKIYELAAVVERDADVDDFCDRDWSGLQGGF